MRREIFNGMWKEISLTFGADYKPSSQKADFTFTKVDSIPDEAVPYITDVICRNESCPRNLIASIHSIYGSWPGIDGLRRNDARGYCNHCKGHRQLYVSYSPDNDGNMYSFAGECGYCSLNGGGITAERAHQRGHVYLGEMLVLPCQIGTFRSRTVAKEKGQGSLDVVVRPTVKSVSPTKNNRGYDW